MTPTKFSTLTNQEVMDKLAQIVVERKDNSTVLVVEPDDASDILLEARNRIEAYDHVKDLFERPAYAQMSLEISPNNILELDIKVKNGGGVR
ncbi:MAG: hypothetical protein K5893_12745 [Prevotella sp.]|nr:hypothetical protein [Prevotella sp.]